MPAPGFSRFSRGRFQQHGKEEHRLNERIRVPEVRLIDETGAQIGIVPTREALRLAREKNLDLMEVAPDARPPVCRITDYGKFKYEKKKKEKEARKKQVVIEVKEVQLRPNTDVHDREFKGKNAREFLQGGDKVKVSMLFRGREMAHTEMGFVMMKDFAKSLSDVSSFEQEPKMEGRKMVMILAPVAKKLSLAQKREIGRHDDADSEVPEEEVED